MTLRDHNSAPVSSEPVSPQVQTAYAVCRSISRSAARNFYYAFLALPREKRDAICAVYAFMRHADDISDEPGLTPDERHARLEDWLLRLKRVTTGEATDDPVLMALADAQYRFAIPPALLETLVEGTAMDVADTTGTTLGTDESAACPEGDDSSAASAGPGLTTKTARPSVVLQYETFDQLYDYCYHVASVVGLICIRIFGYHDPAAEPLAERCGVAFQLTNIIRDVKEDASMGRIYLPREDLDRFGIVAADLENASSNGGNPDRFRPLLAFEAERAREFYASAQQLLPYIDEDSRPALWVLVTIYRKLLEKIAARGYDVFGEKVRLSFWEKFSVLVKGAWQRLSPNSSKTGTRREPA